MESPLVDKQLSEHDLQCFNSATAVSRGVTELPVSLEIKFLKFQFGHGGEPWSHRTARQLGD